MFDKLGRLVAQQYGSFLAVWVAVALFLSLIAPPFDRVQQDDDIHFLPARCMSLAGHDLLARAFPDEVFASKIIFAFARQTAPLAGEDLALVSTAAKEVETCRATHPELGLGPVSYHATPVIGSRLISQDRQCTLIVVPVATPFLAMKTGNAVRMLETRLKELVTGEPSVASGSEATDVTHHAPPTIQHSSDLRFATTGPSAIGRDLNQAVLQSLEGTTTATVGLVVIILLLVYRSPILALIPLVTIASSVWISLNLLAVLAMHTDFQLTTVTRIFVVVVLYGAGTDYCLFLISRYRENLERGCGFTQAIRLSLRQVGWALTASAGTVICGMGMMGFAEFVKIRYTGPAIAISLMIALAASLTLAPVLLTLLGSWAFWPRRIRRRSDLSVRGWTPARSDKPPSTQHPFWQWIGAQVARRPMAIWLASVLLFLPFAWLGYRTHYVYAICAELPRHTESRRGLEMISQHFIPGEVGPLSILLQSQQDWTKPAGREFITRLSESLAALPNVADVRSFTQPLGKPLASNVDEGRRIKDDNTEKTGSSLVFHVSSLLEKLAEPMAKRHYVAQLPEGNVTRVDLIFCQDPFAVESVRSLDDVKASVDRFLSGAAATSNPVVAKSAFYGVTTITHDLAEIHESDRLRVNGLVLGSIFLILLALQRRTDFQSRRAGTDWKSLLHAMLRRTVFALYLLVTVLFSYYVTIGGIELISATWLHIPLGQVDWKVPYFLFTILVSVGEDYNIFLLTRVFEEAKRYGLRQGTQRALASTGATITSCGLIMAGAFATMTLCTLTTLVQLGMALALGVLLDTFVVRPILVPAFLLMTSRRELASQQSENPPTTLAA